MSIRGTMSTMVTADTSRVPGGEASGGLTVLVVDDEAPAVDELSYLLGRIDRIDTVLTATGSTAALRLVSDRLARGERLDMVFLDIDMPGLDGLELAGLVAAFADPPRIVFVTAHDEHALTAFDLGAADYLLKPVHPDRLARAVDRAVDRAAPGPGAAADPAARETAAQPGDDARAVLTVDAGGVTVAVHRDEVVYLAADGDYTRVHTAAGSHLVRMPISALEARWHDAGFQRVHRSFAVAMDRVAGIRTTGGATVVVLRPAPGAAPVELPVSRRSARDLKDRLVAVHAARRPR